MSPHLSWWHHDMETFFILLVICEDKYQMTGHSNLYTFLCCYTEQFMNKNSKAANELRCHDSGSLGIPDGVQIMYNAKPLPVPMLTYCQLGW